MKTKKVTIFLITLATGFLFTLGSCQKETNLKGDANTSEDALKASGPSASGQAGIMLNDRLQNFAFHAKQDKNGNVTGSWQSKSSGQDIKTHGTITCLTIDPDSKIAAMGGIITQINSDDPFFSQFEVGDPIWFQVQDNGEGSSGNPDGFSDYFLDWEYCEIFPDFFTPIVTGNIQVKP